MLFLQWEARDWGWLTRTPAHPPRAARAGHPRGEESLTRTGLRDPAPEGFGQGQHSRPRRNGTGVGGPRGGVPWIEGCPHGTAECPPAAAASALGARASPARACRGLTVGPAQPSPRSFSPGSVNPEGAGGGAAPPSTAWPPLLSQGKATGSGQDQPGGAQCPQLGAASLVAFGDRSGTL